MVPSVMLDEVTVFVARSVPVTVPSVMSVLVTVPSTMLDEFTEFVARSALTIVPSTISAELMSVPRVALICVPGVMVIPVPAV